MCTEGGRHTVAAVCGGGCCVARLLHAGHYSSLPGDLTDCSLRLLLVVVVVVLAAMYHATIVYRVAEEGGMEEDTADRDT